MNSPATDHLGKKEKVTILLQEYATLRSEILTRSTHIFQLIAATAVVFGWVMSKPRQELDGRFWFGMLVAALGLAYVGWLISRDIGKAARRLRELESEINHRAGEELLVWETKWGGAVTGYFGPASPLAKIMTLNDRLLKIDALCSNAHALLNQIATRDAAAYPLPQHLEPQITGAIAQLTEARDALNDLAAGDSKN